MKPAKAPSPKAQMKTHNQLLPSRTKIQALSTEPGPTVTENAEGASSVEYKRKCRRRRTRSGRRCRLRRRALFEPDEGAQPERWFSGCYDPETTAEFAESLTPGEETLFKASEETAAEIAEKPASSRSNRGKENTSKSARAPAIICASQALLR